MLEIAGRRALRVQLKKRLHDMEKGLRGSATPFLRVMDEPAYLATLFTGLPARYAFMFSIMMCMRRSRAAVLAQAMWGVM